MKHRRESASLPGEMMEDDKLLIVGGSGRNVGKTEFLCRLIRNASPKHAIFGLKVSAVFPDEERYHGEHGSGPPADTLFEETRDDTLKDTSRMLRSGARRVFYLRGEDEEILNGYFAFRKQIPQNAVAVCESNSLAHYVRPALFILVTATRAPLKARTRDLLPRADMIIESNGTSGFPELDRIELSTAGSWIIRDQT